MSDNFSTAPTGGYVCVECGNMRWAGTSHHCPTSASPPFFRVRLSQQELDAHVSQQYAAYRREMIQHNQEQNARIEELESALALTDDSLRNSMNATVELRALVAEKERELAELRKAAKGIREAARKHTTEHPEGSIDQCDGCAVASFMLDAIDCELEGLKVVEANTEDK